MQPFLHTRGPGGGISPGDLRRCGHSDHRDSGGLRYGASHPAGCALYYAPDPAAPLRRPRRHGPGSVHQPHPLEAQQQPLCLPGADHGSVSRGGAGLFGTEPLLLSGRRPGLPDAGGLRGLSPLPQSGRSGGDGLRLFGESLCHPRQRRQASGLFPSGGSAGRCLADRRIFKNPLLLPLRRQRRPHGALPAGSDACTHSPGIRPAADAHGPELPGADVGLSHSHGIVSAL